MEKMIGEFTKAINGLTDAITPRAAMGARMDDGGYVESLTEATMYVGKGLASIAEAIQEVAEAIREQGGK